MRELRMKKELSIVHVIMPDDESVWIEHAIKYGNTSGGKVWDKKNTNWLAYF